MLKILAAGRLWFQGECLLNDSAKVFKLSFVWLDITPVFGSLQLLLLWLQHHLTKWNSNMSAHSETARCWWSRSLRVGVTSGCSAANWSQADVPIWALNAVCCSPTLGVSNWGSLLGKYRCLPLEATVTLIHTNWICSLFRRLSLSTFHQCFAPVEDLLIKVTSCCRSLKLWWASIDESRWDVKTSRII